MILSIRTFLYLGKIMYNRIQFDCLTPEKSFHKFLKTGLSNLLFVDNLPTVVIGQVVLPGIMLGDCNLPIFSFYQKGEYINDLEKALNFTNFLVTSFKHFKSNSSHFMKVNNFATNQYMVCFDYMILTKRWFEDCLVGEFHEELLTNEDAKSLLKNAYAEFLIYKNIQKKIDTDPQFVIQEFESNVKTKLELLEYCIEKYNFDRFMKIEYQSSIGETQVFRMFI